MCDTCGCNTPDNHSHNEHDKRLLELHEDVMSSNEVYAQQNREYFNKQKIFTVNLLSSPGSGKTTLLEKTIRLLKNSVSVAVIEGDQQTELDADRIRSAGANALQINTGAGCHLDAHQISHAIKEIELDSNSLLMIENVGNLVCPSMFNLGEHFKVVILSVTEGDDKPLKYPHMFHAADIVVFNKTDLLPYVDFDIEKSQSYAKQINPKVITFELSAKTGEGMTDWIDWLKLNLTNK
ncbi:MAG: hydrogenase nickel incorporation protein HypB [Candidatus Marinimicrobia bacterium]|nr:hydrogenase nickel incorporation protein HypB [Candidatus Neomarinimicrobiota bacterium]MBL7023308.1 hydrogenase nickel incorporation protein HypB [Candidatus Neomarinimicrobiota bacterium]